MFIDRIADSIFTFLFGRDTDGDRKVWLHTINRNEDKQGHPKFPPYHGQAFLHMGRKRECSLEWNLWSSSCGVYLHFDPSEHGWGIRLAFPPFAFYFHHNFFTKWMNKLLASERVDKWNQSYGGYKGSSKYTMFSFFDVSFFNWGLHWDIWKFDWGWSHKMPKWMDGHIDFADLVLGRMKYTEKVLEERDMVIQMPEGEYKAKGKLVSAIRKRPRWFGKPDLSITVDIPKGIPHQGKGENSWDCGTDGLFGYGYGGDNWREAADRGTQIVLESRKKYDGSRMAKYPAPLDNSDLNALLVEAGKGPVSPTP